MPDRPWSPTSAPLAPLKVLSLGAGVQSSCLLLMSCRGELPKLDAAIFADTGWEPKAVYEHLTWLESEAARAGIPVHRVRHGDLRQDVLDAVTTGGQGRYTMPLYVIDAAGRKGMGKRQCTTNYKIRPIERFIRRELLGLKAGEVVPKQVAVEQWYGITWDESRRARLSQNRWQVNVYPFLGKYGDGPLPRPWRREHCVAWLSKWYPDRAFVKSACLGCPFKANDQWRKMRNRPDEWADVLAFDEAIRHGANDPEAVQFVHRSARPLAQVDFRTDAEGGEPSLWENECEGMCGV